MDWIFSDPPNVAVMTTQSVIRDVAWIARVCHDADDGSWQFHDSSEIVPREEDAAIVSLRSMVLRDGSLNELADLPQGWCAWRNSPDAPWQRAEVEPAGNRPD